MGIPHLTTYLSPYATRQELSGRDIVVDGPGFAYHIYYTCLRARPQAPNSLEAAPSYEELQNTSHAWLDKLRDCGIIMWVLEEPSLT